MSTDNNNDRWKEGNTVVDHDYREAPAGLFVKAEGPNCQWYAHVGNGHWVCADGVEHRGPSYPLFSKRIIIPRPPDAPARIPHYPPQQQNGADMNAGRKDDSGKNRLDLLPPHALWQVGLALTFGAKEYGDNNWRKVPDARKRYTAALMRHVVAWMMGERNDSKSGLHHLAHAGACIMFLLDVEVKP